MLAASLLAALLAACVPRTAVAHMTLASPKPFGNPTTSPLSSDGSNYPCQIVGDAATFYATSAAAANNTLAIGTPQTLSFAGSAVHGGGSCQLALTSDLQPSASTAWQVILSIEGGCPTVDGSGPSTYDYTIPDSIAPGAYVFAWTWISKLSGAPEYYMNCAPVTVTAGSGPAKRDAAAAAAAAADAAADAAARVAAVLAGRDDSNATSPASSSSALPNLFVANLASINSCKTTTSTDPLYPDPGPNVSKPSKMTTNFQAVSGTNCFPLGGSDSGSGNSTTGNSGSGNTTDPATTTAAAAAPPATTSATASSVAVPVGSGTNSTTAAAANTTATAATTTAAPATTTAAPATTTTAAATGGSSSGSALSGACTNEGTFNCVAGTQYQQCASGAWTALQAMPAGTQCQPGESTTLWARDLAAADYNGTAPDDGGGGGDPANNGTDTTTPPPATTDGGLTGACTVEGLFNCVGGALYQQCAVGLWSTLQAMPAGTACQEGQSATLWARSAKRSDNSTLPDGGGGNTTTAGGGGSTNTTSPTPVDSGAGGGGGGAGLSGACTAEGTFNCVGGTQYQQCAVGAWSPLQAMPAGTACQEGQSATLWARRRDVAAAGPAAASSVAAAAGPASSAAAVPVPASSVAPAATAAPSAAPSAAAASTGLTGACATEGLFNCVGGTQYQQCAAGAWTALQAIPAGTACQEGESTTLWARDEARPRFHARRRRRQQRQRRM